jgi:hypothetical protein
MSEAQRHITKKTGLWGILLATQSMGAWFAVAQPDACSAPKQQSSAVPTNTKPVAAISPSRRAPTIAVSPRNLDFGPVAVGETKTLTLTVQNVGGGILSGAARVSAPFALAGGSPYVLGSSQSQVITVRYVPRVTGLNMTVLLLTGGGGASMTVAGSAVLAPPAAPARPATPSRPTAPASPQNLRQIAVR